MSRENPIDPQEPKQLITAEDIEQILEESPMTHVLRDVLMGQIIFPSNEVGGPGQPEYKRHVTPQEVVKKNKTL